MRYPKFGYGFATDYAARMVRYGMLTREQAVEFVKKYDHRLDLLCVRDFCEFAGYTESEYRAIEDRLYITELFLKMK